MKKVDVYRDDDGHFWCDGEPVEGLPRLYDEDDVAEYLGVTVHTVRYWRKHGKIEYVKIEGQIRFTHQSLLDLVRDRAVEAWGRAEMPSDSPLASEVA